MPSVINQVIIPAERQAQRADQSFSQAESEDSLH